VNLRAELLNDFPVDFDNAGKDQFIILAPRSDPCKGKVLVQANSFLMNP
jgi:hypothetical protein